MSNVFSMYDVITIGAATRDVFLKSKNFQPVSDKRFPSGWALSFELESKNEVDNVILSTGGGATNAAVTFTRQGLKTACVARVGNDSFGAGLISNLTQEKVFCGFIQKDKKPETGYSTILATPEGARVILVRRGVASGIKFAEIDLKKLKAKWFYITSLGGNLKLLSDLLKYAKNNNIRVAFNPGGQELKYGIKKLGSYLKHLSLLQVNQDEASELVGIPLHEEKKIFNKLHELVDGIVVMTKGPQGVSVSDAKNIYCAGVPQAPVVERTGAGDAFGSGFVSALLHNKDIPYAIQLATANSTSVVQYFSAKTGILKKGKWGKWPRVKVATNTCY